MEAEESHPEAEGCAGLNLIDIFRDADGRIERVRLGVATRTRRSALFNPVLPPWPARVDNIFKQLDERALTASEELIIQQRASAYLPVDANTQKQRDFPS